MRRRRPGHGHGRRAPVGTDDPAPHRPPRRRPRGQPRGLAAVPPAEADRGRPLDRRRSTRRTSPGSSASSRSSSCSSMVGDDPLTASQVDQVLRRRAGMDRAGRGRSRIALGLRSGSRGGPLALERAEVRHVLLAPVDRTTALRAPAIRQLRFLAFVGMVAGGDRRATWPPSGFDGQHPGVGGHRRRSPGLTLVGAVRRARAGRGRARGCPRWAASLIGLVLAGAGRRRRARTPSRTSPTAPVRRAGAVAAAVPRLRPAARRGGRRAWSLAGLALLGRTSPRGGRATVDAWSASSGSPPPSRTCARSSSSAASSRWSCPASDPWVRLRVRGTGRWPVFTRGLRGVLRWPGRPRARASSCSGRSRGSALRGALGRAPRR